MKPSKLTLDGREVEIGDIGGVDPRDYPDFCDAYIESAIWLDTGLELDDADLDRLQDKYADLVYEMAFEYYI